MNGARARALTLLPVAYALAFASSGVQLPMTSTAMASVGLSMSAVGAMWAARAGVGIFAPALWGVLADRHGDAGPFARALFFVAAGLLLALAFTTTPLPAVALFALFGLFGGSAVSLLDGLVLTAVGDHQARFGRVRAFGTMGFGVTALGSALLVDARVVAPLPRVLFPICAALTASAAVILLFLPRLPRPSLVRLRDVLPVVFRRDVVMLFLLSTLLWMSHVGFQSFITPLSTSRGIPGWAVGASLASAIAVEVLMLRQASRLLARFGARRLLLTSCAVAALRWGALAMVTTPALVIALHGLHGVTLGLFFGVFVTVLAQRTPPQMQQAVLGTVGSASFGLGGVLGSLIVGNLLERTDASTTWWAMCALAVSALVIAAVGVDRDTA